MKKIILATFLSCGLTVAYGQVFNVKVNGKTPKTKNTTTSDNKPVKSEDPKVTEKGPSAQPDMTFDASACNIVVTPTKSAFDIKVNFKLVNNSKTPVAKGFHLSFYLCKSENARDTIKQLADWEVPVEMCANCDYKNYYSFNIAHSSFQPLADGKYYVSMVLDNTNNLLESNEENNWTSINTPIDYVTPDGVKEYNLYAAEKGETDKFLVENAGQVLFGVGTYNFTSPNNNKGVSEISFQDLTDSKGSDEFGEELSFTVIFQKPIPELFEGYRKEGLNSKA